MIGEPEMRIHTFIKRLLPLVACFLLATAGKGDGIPAHTREEAERGDAIEQWIMGYYYAYGDGVPQDHKEAVKWYRKAAEQGLSNAQLCLGLQYAEGRGVPLNYKEAVKWYRKAAEQGYARAQSILGARYALGKGVPQDYKEAVKWHRKAAEQGYVGAQYRCNGAKVPKVPQGILEAA